LTNGTASDLNLPQSKETTSRIKKQPTEWEKIFTRYYLDEGLIYRTYKNLKINHLKKTNLINNWANELNIALKTTCKTDQ
jgi:hypothetical protein